MTQFTITADDIKRGTTNRQTTNPIALAVARALQVHPECVRLYDQQFEVDVYDYTTYYRVPAGLHEWFKRYLMYGPAGVLPITSSLEEMDWREAA